MAVCLAILAVSTPASASTVLYRTDAELIGLSSRVVHARVLKQRTERPDPSGAIFTVTTLAVLEDFTGVSGDTVEVWELGGVYGDEGMYVGGAVEYGVGREVLVCLGPGRFGLRSLAMGFSKFDVAPIAGQAADGRLVRNLSGLQTIGGSASGAERTLAQFRDLTVQVRGRQPVRNLSADLMVPDDTTQPRFTTLTGGASPRWFEADTNTPVQWYQSTNAPNPLTSGDAVAEIQNALAAWTNPTSASIILQYVGTTSNVGTGPWTGIPSNAGVISWEDPQNNINNPTLAVGGGFFSSNGGTVNGVAYSRFVRGYVLFQNAADLSASFRQSLNFTRVLEHEIGHTIGLGHTDTPDNPNPNIMFASCCTTSTPTPPALGPDDLLGVNTIYPSGSTPACSFTISPTSASPTAAGGSANVIVTASASTCAWTAAIGTATFATITAGSNGTGSGSVTYSVSANTAPSSRSGTLLIAGQTLTITQAPGNCTYSISPTSASATNVGGSASVTVTPSNSACTWGATVGTATFASITSGATGTGTGTVTYSVSANMATSQRSGTLTIAGQTFTITQAAAPAGCTYAIAPTSVSVGGGATTTPVTVTTAAGCPWDVVQVSTFITVASGSPSSGNGTATLAIAANGATVRTGTATVAGQTFTVTQAARPTMATDRAALNFGAVTTGTSFTLKTPAQNIRLTQTGAGTVTWTAASNQPWLTVSPASGTGSALLTVGVQFVAGLSSGATGAITITYTGSATASSAVNAMLNLPAQSAAPVGVLDTPAQGATGLQGSIAVTGWALDDIGIDRVEIWRDLQPGETTPPFASSPSDPRNGKIFVSNGTFVEGARPDVEGLNPTTPLNYRAGWGYLLLTWGLWAQGNGTYVLHAFAFDLEGKVTTIGRKTIGVSNNAADKPFGSIDTPGIGGTISGTAVNFGWGLTPKVNGVATCKIGPTGAQVSIDSGPLQPVDYGANRSDIAGAFAGFSNSSGAGGSYIIDTTTLANGTHTIGWLLSDDCNRVDGVGSRFFNVQNGSLVAAPAQAELQTTDVTVGAASDPITVSRGSGELPEIVSADADGDRTIRVSTNERIEVLLPRGFDGAYQLVNGERRPLPTGATWDAASQTFYWQPAAGFLGEYQLVFARGSQQLRVLIVVR